MPKSSNRQGRARRLVDDLVKRVAEAVGRLREAVGEVADRVRKWSGRHGQTVHDEMLRGISYGVGSGAVSLLVIWYETRR